MLILLVLPELLALELVVVVVFAWTFGTAMVVTSAVVSFQPVVFLSSAFKDSVIAATGASFMVFSIIVAVP